MSSSAIDKALIAYLGSDATLLAICTNGVYWSEAPPNATAFVIVDLVSAFDEATFGGRAIEDCLYLVEARVKDNNTVMDAAADRIDTLLEDHPLSVGGYNWMDTYREERLRNVEVDEINPDIRFYRRGGHYRLRFSIGP